MEYYDQFVPKPDDKKTRFIKNFYSDRRAKVFESMEHNNFEQSMFNAHMEALGMAQK